MQKKTTTSVIGLFLLAGAVTLGMFTLFVVSAVGFVQHWHTVALPCTECVSSFVANTTAPSHIAYAVGMFFSLLAAIRAFFFIKKQYLFHKPIRVYTKERGVRLVKNAPLAAWSAGIMQPRIYADATFWYGLTDLEKDTLIAHEQTHIEQQDVARQLLLGWVKVLLPIPFLHAWLGASLQHMRMESELYADSNAMKKTSAGTLAQLLKKTLSVEGHLHSHIVAPAIDGLMQERLRQMKGERVLQSPRGILLLPAVSMLSMLFVVVTIAGVLQVQPIHSCVL